MRAGEVVKWIAGGLALILMSFAVVLLQSLDSQIGQLRGQLYDVSVRASQEIRGLSERLTSIESRRR